MATLNPPSIAIPLRAASSNPGVNVTVSKFGADWPPCCQAKVGEAGVHLRC
jgi:hypothetical protein